LWLSSKLIRPRGNFPFENNDEKVSGNGNSLRWTFVFIFWVSNDGPVLPDGIHIFIPKNQSSEYFERPWNVFFRYISCPFVILGSYLVYTMPIWYGLQALGVFSPILVYCSK
jgi:hypothetical protein